MEISSLIINWRAVLNLKKRQQQVAAAQHSNLQTNLAVVSSAGGSSGGAFSSSGNTSGAAGTVDSHMVLTGANSKSITQPNSPRITITKQMVKNSDKSKSNGSSFANGKSGSHGLTGGLNIGQTIVMPNNNNTSDYQGGGYMIINEPQFDNIKTIIINQQTKKVAVSNSKMNSEVHVQQAPVKQTELQCEAIIQTQINNTNNLFPLYGQQPQQSINPQIANMVNKIVLPKGIIRFNNQSANRGQSTGSKSAEKTTSRKGGQSHEPREESLRRKKKVMQIIRNFEKDRSDVHSNPLRTTHNNITNPSQNLDIEPNLIVQPSIALQIPQNNKQLQTMVAGIQGYKQQQLNPKELSLLLKSKILKQPRNSHDSAAGINGGLDPLMTSTQNNNDTSKQYQQVKSKIIVHRRINKTFAAIKPEQSIDKPKAIPPNLPVADSNKEKIGKNNGVGGGIRQRDKIPQSRGESPLMNDLNWYLMNKDHDYIGSGPVIGKQHLIGINPPPISTNGLGGIPDEKLNKFAKIKPSISRERVGLNANQLLINLQNYNYKQTSMMLSAAVNAAVTAPPKTVVNHKRQLSDLNQQ